MDYRSIMLTYNSQYTYIYIYIYTYILMFRPDAQASGLIAISTGCSVGEQGFASFRAPVLFCTERDKLFRTTCLNSWMCKTWTALNCNYRNMLLYMYIRIGLHLTCSCCLTSDFEHAIDYTYCLLFLQTVDKTRSHVVLQVF